MVCRISFFKKNISDTKFRRTVLPVFKLFINIEILFW